MYVLALATDYDGTLADHGTVSTEVLTALEKLKQTGRKLIMVTGRELPDLREVFPQLDIFDMIVAENGALLYDPATRKERALAPSPPEEFVARLRAGFDLVVGNRFAGGIAPGAMPALHHLGVPALSALGRWLFRAPVGDFHCGLRGFSREAMDALALETPGMELASEMIVKAALAKLRICEVPTTLAPDGRAGPGHLRTFRDGLRHVRYLVVARYRARER